MTGSIAFGITAAERRDHARLGRELEKLGYKELWANDTRRGDGIATLADVADGAPRLRLAVGVVALSDHAPRRIAKRVRDAGLSAGSMTVGVGSGSSASLALVRDGVAALRELLPDHPIAVAAVGPRMARLAGEVADAVVASWGLPSRLASVRRWVSEGAASAGRPAPRLVSYVRVAVGPGAAERLRIEQARYARGAQYARAFAAQPAEPIGVAIDSGEPAAVATALAPYRAVVDTLVVRGLPASDDVDAWLGIAAGAAVAIGAS